MPKFTVHFEGTASVSATVEAEDFDQAMEKAFEVIPYDVCAHCSGWGKDYGLELPGEWREYEVTDESGKTVYRREEEA